MRTINRILVANRGEIALRVCRTATDMGIATIAVYADQDMAAPHTREADEALSLGGDDAASTYLNGEKILAIALETGADAIHPGYGFLSENSEFARAVEDAGIAWLGPASSVIDALGDKIKARRVAEACGVAPVPGVSEPVTSREEVEAFIASAGYRVTRTPPTWALTSSSVLSRSPVTSRHSPRVTRWVTSTSSRPVTARCSVATRSWSKRLPPRSCPRVRTRRS